MPKIRENLSPKQKAFVEIFCAENGRLTPTECAKQAGLFRKKCNCSSL